MPAILLFGLFGMLIALALVPFRLVFGFLTYRLREKKLPYSFRTIGPQIKAAFPCEIDSETYKRYLCLAYFNPSYEPTTTESDNVAILAGIINGQKLASGELDFASLPDLS